eukprot:tig00000571_g2159.t1
MQGFAAFAGAAVPRSSFAPVRRSFCVRASADGDHSDEKKKEKHHGQHHHDHIEFRAGPAPPLTVPFDTVRDEEDLRRRMLKERLRGTALNNATPETIRNIVLLLSLFPLISNYFCYDIVAALQSYIKAGFGIDNVGFSQLYTVYEVPNIIMPLIGGAIIDRVGTKQGAFIFALLVLAGVATVASGPFFDAYWVMLLGRVIYGLGAEALNVTMDVIYAKWFSGKGMAFASGVGVFACRLGDVLSFNIGPPVAERFGGFQYALLMAPMAATMSAAAMFAYGYIDSLADHAASVPPSSSSATPAPTPSAEKEPAAAGEMVDEEKEEEGPQGPLAAVMELFSTVPELPPVFWIIACICFFYYATYFPFQAFAPEFMAQKFQYTAEQAARVTSTMGIVSMFLSPGAGLAVDKVGKRAFIAAMCAAIMIPCLFTLTFTPLPPYLPMAVMGCMFSFVPSAIWPALAILVDPSLHGVAYGALTSMINIGLLASYFAVGKAADTLGVLWGVPLVLMIFVTLGWSCAIAWNFVDARTGGLANATDDRIAEILAARAARAEAEIAAAEAASKKDA